MALVHHFLSVSPDISTQMIPFRKEYVVDGEMQRYASFESVPRPINALADDNAGDILSDFYNKNKVRAVRVHDKYILKNLLNFQCVETYYIGFVPCMGINYYGFTLIPWESIPTFVSILKKNSVKNCFAELLSICAEAYIKHFDILHCGV